MCKNKDEWASACRCLCVDSTKPRGRGNTNLKTYKRQTQEAWSHVQSLTVQGTSLASIIIIENILKKNVTAWSQTLSNRAAPIFNSPWKALINQLHTNVNLVLWKLSLNPNCVEISNPQTTKHVLSNVERESNSSGALNRYRRRHDAILMLLATWLQSVFVSAQSLYTDMDVLNFHYIIGRDNSVLWRPMLIGRGAWPCHRHEWLTFDG